MRYIDARVACLQRRRSPACGIAPPLARRKQHATIYTAEHAGEHVASGQCRAQRPDKYELRPRAALRCGEGWRCARAVPLRPRRSAKQHSRPRLRRLLRASSMRPWPAGIWSAPPLFRGLSSARPASSARSAASADAMLRVAGQAVAGSGREARRRDLSWATPLVHVASQTSGACRTGAHQAANASCAASFTQAPPLRAAARLARHRAAAPPPLAAWLCARRSRPLP